MDKTHGDSVSTTVPAKGTTWHVKIVLRLSVFQLPCPRRARQALREPGRAPSRFNYRAREGHDGDKRFLPQLEDVSTTVPAKGTTWRTCRLGARPLFQLPCPRRARRQNACHTAILGGFNYRAREGHDGITVLYGNTNIFFPILREVCDLRICMVLCL